MVNARNDVSLYPGRDSNSYSTLVLEDFESGCPIKSSPAAEGFHDAQVARPAPSRQAESGAILRANPESIPSLAADHYSRSYRAGWQG